MLPPTEQNEIYQYISSLKTTATIKQNENTYYLAHAYPDVTHTGQPINTIPYMDIWQTVWCSAYRKPNPYEEDDNTYIPLSEYPDGAITICGHVPVINCGHQQLEPLFNWRVLNIDGGCAQCGTYRSDRTGIICYCLETEEYTAYSFADLIDDLIDQDAPDNVLQDALGAAATPIIQFRNHFRNRTQAEGVLSCIFHQFIRSVVHIAAAKISVLKKK